MTELQTKHPSKRPRTHLNVCLMFLLALASFWLNAPMAAFGQQDPLQKLYEAAKPEKEVIWQWQSAITEINSVINIFRKKYPDIKLSVVSIGATTIPTRVIVEASAGKVSVDVGTAGTSYLLPLIERDLLARYNWAQIADIDPENIAYDGRLINYSGSAFICFYNTHLVSKAESPKTLEDLLAPKWKGEKIVVRAAPSGFNSLFPVWKQNKQKAIDYLTRLAKQEIVPGKRAAEVTDRVARGENPIAISSIGSTYDAIRRGAPLALCPIGPASCEPAAFFIPKGARHPEAAKFFVAWMASPEGRRALTELGFGPIYPPNASPQARLLADSGISFIPIGSPEDIREFTGPFTDAVIKIMKFLPE
jgi:iron(III) transport system substrate-binding protein